MKHSATDKFWRHFKALPQPVQDLARKNFELLKSNPRHASLRFKKIGDYRSIRIGLHYRALGTVVADGVVWFWIGSHTDYDKLLA